MNSKVIIRSAKSEDAKLLAGLGRETFHDAFCNYPQMPQTDLAIYLDEAFTVKRLTEELADENSGFLLAEVSGETVGYAKLEANNRISGVTLAKSIKLKRLYCKQSAVGFGIGAELMRRCLLEAAKQKYKAIWLTVWEHNLPAQNFYRRWNFESCGTIDFLLGESSLTDLIMQRPLA